MAYVNEFGETVSCSVPFSDQLNNFFFSWYVTLLPLIVLICVFFLIKKYTKNKEFLTIYTVIAVVSYVWWLPKTFLMCE